jgi:heme oxygenase
MTSEIELRRLMLRGLHQRVRAAENEDDLLVAGRTGSSVELRSPDFVDLVSEANQNRVQAAKLFARLVREKFVVLEGTPVETGGLVEIAWVSDLTDKGLAAIGELPDVQERFIAGLQAAMRQVEADDSLPEDEKQRRINWLEKGVDLAGNVGSGVLSNILSGGITPMA